MQKVLFKNMLMQLSMRCFNDFCKIFQMPSKKFILGCSFFQYFLPICLFCKLHFENKLKNF